jgi:hypothetical protein
MGPRRRRGGYIPSLPLGEAARRVGEGRSPSDTRHLTSDTQKEPIDALRNR